MPDYKYETLLVDQDESVLTVTLNRPERLNAVDRTMHRELEEVFGAVAFDGSVSAVVVTGAGRGFCSGGDVRAMDERGSENVLEQRPMGAVSQSGRRILHNLLWVEQATVPILRESESAGLAAAAETLLTVRVELHRLTGQRADRPLLELQDDAAAALDLADADVLSPAPG